MKNKLLIVLSIACSYGSIYYSHPGDLINYLYYTSQLTPDRSTIDKNELCALLITSKRTLLSYFFSIVPATYRKPCRQVYQNVEHKSMHTYEKRKKD